METVATVKIEATYDSNNKKEKEIVDAMLALAEQLRKEFRRDIRTGVTK